MTIVQKPNAILIVWIVAKIATYFTSGQLHTFAATVALVALSGWAYDELALGVNGFRKALGAIVLIGLVVTTAGLI